MSSVVQVMQIMFYGVATLFMICFMIIGIWAFVLYTKMFKNNRIQNYLLQNSYNDFQDESFDNSSSVIKESLFEQSKSDDMNHSDSLYKIK